MLRQIATDDDEPMPHDAFISYAHDDRMVADAACAKLEATGIVCWIAPRDALAGVSYPGQLVDAIGTARLVVLILSSHSAASRQVRSEIERAFSRGIPIVPIRIEDVLPEGDLEYLIGSVQWLDALIPPIEPHLDELVNVVRRILAGELPEKQTLRVNPNNLPDPMNRLIGREADLDEIRRLLGDHRLVTITGSGGVGKTRVAIEAGRSLLTAYRDGVWFVPLATVSDPTLLPNAVAQALAAPEGPDLPLGEIVVQFLKRRHALLILDNCEHLIAEAAAFAAPVLGACSEVQILVTGREHLNIAGEWTYRLPSLAVAAVGSAIGTSQLASVPAVDLFVERAHAADATFAFSVSDAPAVADICRRLDGIPFAIELAARQQTMRACIDWSYDLLSDAERTLFRRMAISPDGCTLTAAEEVCKDDAVPAACVLNLVSALTSKSLVSRRSDGSVPAIVS